MLVIPMTSPILPSMKISGRLSLRSHLPTACGVTLKRSANCAWERPMFFRPSAIRVPIIVVFIVHLTCGTCRYIRTCTLAHPDKGSICTLFFP